MLAALVASSMLTSTPSAPVRVEIVRQSSEYRLLRGGKPYFIQGSAGDDSEDMLLKLKAAGGNSTRTWGAENLGPMLDRADRLGITVIVGVWLGHKEHGFKWDDPVAVKKQFDTTLEFVRQYRNHPAVLAWAMGNEMEINNDTPVVWKAMGDLIRAVKREDPVHPVMTVVAEVSPEKVRHINEFCPELDMLGVNTYGPVQTLPKRLKEFGFTKPYLVTEFGPPGQWEVPKTAWGAPLEKTSTEKAALYAAAYQKAVLDAKGFCLGSYAFVWGWKQEETPTWHGLWLESGEKLGGVDELSRLWTGKYPKNRCPLLSRAALDGPAEVSPSQAMTTRADATDPDGDACVYEWTVRSDEPGRHDGEGEKLPEKFAGGIGVPFSFKAPARTGRYRIYLKVTDGKGGAATANIPIKVG